MSIYEEFISGVQSGGLTNPYGLAAVAATGKHESGYSPSNVYGQWSDPSERGVPGMAGGVMSWRAERLDNMRRFAASQGDDPSRPSPSTQAKYFLSEDPRLVEQLQQAKSVDEAQRLMNNAWRFAGYNRPGGEAAARAQTARSLLGGGGVSAMPDTVSEQGGSNMAYGGTGNDELRGAMPQAQGGLGGLGGFFSNPGVSDSLQAMGMSLMSSPRNAPLSGVGQYLPGIQDRRERREAGVASAAEKNRTLEYLRSNFPDIASQVDAGLPIPDAFKMAADERRRQAEGPSLTSDERNFMRAQSDPAYADYLKQGTGGQFGVNPVYGVDPETGETVLGQMSKSGEFVRTEMPEGFQPLSPYGINEQKARGTAVGKGMGENVINLPSTMQLAKDIDKQITDLKEDPYLDRMLGPVDSRLPNFSADAARVQAKMDQIQGGAFLQGRQMLKGGGAITDFESTKAEQAFVRMNAAQSPEDYKAALDDFNYYVQAGARKLAEMTGGTDAPSGQPKGKPSSLQDKYGLE